MGAMTKPTLNVFGDYSRWHGLSLPFLYFIVNIVIQTGTQVSQSYSILQWLEDAITQLQGSLACTNIFHGDLNKNISLSASFEASFSCQHRKQKLGDHDNFQLKRLLWLKRGDNIDGVLIIQQAKGYIKPDTKQTGVSEQNQNLQPKSFANKDGKYHSKCITWNISIQNSSKHQ